MINNYFKVKDNTSHHYMQLKVAGPNSVPNNNTDSTSDCIIHLPLPLDTIATMHPMTVIMNSPKSSTIPEQSRDASTTHPKNS